MTDIDPTDVPPPDAVAEPPLEDPPVDGAVFDLDAAIAERAPIPPFLFKFGGVTFTLPGSPDVRALADLQTSDDLSKTLVLLFGEANREQLDSVGGVFDVDALKLVVEAWTSHANLDAGEAPAS